MSKVFELHFNPISTKRMAQGPHKLNLAQGRIHHIPFFKKIKKENTIFDTFCFLPKTRNENKLGKLYLMGEMKNAFQDTQNLLHEIADIIKEEYYQYNYETPQDCFRSSLEKADELINEIKRKNTGFLENLGFTAISVLPDFSVSISKVGTSKIFLLTGKNIFDVGDNFNKDDSPIHTFPNVVEGSLESTDKIIIVTEKLFDTFYEQEIFHHLIDIKKTKQIKELFKQKKPALTQAFGCCLLVFVKKELPKIFLQSSASQRSPIQENNQPTSKLQQVLKKIPHKPTFLQKNFSTMLSFATVLLILLVLGWMLF